MSTDKLHQLHKQISYSKRTTAAAEQMSLRLS